MISTADAVAALGIGLAGAGHCLGMCGGIASALSLGGQYTASGALAYHGGRLCSYTALGALLAGAAGSIDIAHWTIALRYLAGALLIAMGLSIADWWRGIAVLERAGAVVWQPVQRVVGRLLPLRHWSHAFPLGLAWGLMPCGLIYSALAWSATAGDAASGALLMLLFGLGTLPAMLGASLGAARLQSILRRRGLKLIIAVLLIAAGTWGLIGTYRHSAHLLQPVSAETPAVEHGTMQHH